jgi:hypothetical protein
MSIILNFFYPLAIILGITGLIILLVRTKEEEDIISIYKKRLSELKEKKQKFQDKIFSEIFPHLSKILLNFLEKVLIRLRIVILRVDNSLFKNLKKIREIKFKAIEDKKGKEGVPFGILNNLEETTRDFFKDFIKAERDYLKRIKKGDFSALQNLARLYLYEEDYPSARWIILEGYRKFPNEKIFQAFLIELFEKEQLYSSKANEKEIDEKPV